MTTVYSTYEAKARFSEVLRKVRAGQRVRITHHGREVAEIAPIVQGEGNLEQRLEDLELQGCLVRHPGPRDRSQVGKPVPGALKRFLEERE